MQKKMAGSPLWPITQPLNTDYTDNFMMNSTILNMVLEAWVREYEHVTDMRA
jgi:hypothetical protein